MIFKKYIYFFYIFLFYVFIFIELFIFNLKICAVWLYNIFTMQTFKTDNRFLAALRRKGVLICGTSVNSQ